MAISLPAADHTPLPAPPLELVVCTIEFSGAEHPEDGGVARAWYEAFGGQHGRFPQLGEVLEQRLEMVAGRGESGLRQQEHRGWRFQNERDTTQLTLLPGQLTLETGLFKHWGDFRPVMEQALQLLVDHLAPTIEQSVGLRFVNRLPMEGESRLDTSIRGLRSHDLLADGVRSYEQRYHVDVDEEIAARVRVGGRYPQAGGVVKGPVLDIESFGARSVPFVQDEALSLLERLNEVGVGLFQQLITPAYLEDLRAGES